MTISALQLDELKTAHRNLWNLGDYAKVADTVIPRLGEALVEATGIVAGDRMLDVAAGAGNAALPAARRGAHVTASDLSHQLLAECCRRAGAEGLDVICTPGDAEDLPFADASFDVVVSSVGVMFAPRHQQVADEIARVTRPGGRIGLLSWTPGGFIGHLFATMKPFMPPPPPAAQPPPLWGVPDHVSKLFGDRVANVEVRTESVRVEAFDDPTGFRKLFASSYGPTIAAYTRHAEDPQRTSELDDAIDDLARAHWNDDGSMEWEYLIVTAHAN